MPITIPDLWSDDIKVDVLHPLAVLKAQEGLLARKTRGLLQARLTTTETDRLVQHDLDLVAPSLNFYRERLLSATHARDKLYPVVVTADCFFPEPGGPLTPASAMLSRTLNRAMNPEVCQRKAATDEEFIELVRAVLQSPEVRSLIHSLVARMNVTGTERPDDASAEANPPPANGEAPGGE
jgi:hypothetical protein